MKLERHFIWKQTIPLIIFEINQCWTQTHQLTAAEWLYYSINHPLKHIMKQIGCFYLVRALDFTDWQHVEQDNIKSKYGDVNNQTSFFLSLAWLFLLSVTVHFWCELKLVGKVTCSLRRHHGGAFASLCRLFSQWNHLTFGIWPFPAPQFLPAGR